MKYIFSFFLIIGLLSCINKKSYEEYNEEDFYRVQGIITKSKRTADPTDYSRNKDIEYKYFLTDSVDYYGTEKGISLVGLYQGAPVVILVNNNDKTTSFYGYNGVLDSVTYGEVKFMKEYLGKIIEKE